MGTSGGADFVGREDVKNVKIKGNTFQVGVRRVVLIHFFTMDRNLSEQLIVTHLLT
jgi:hypothetical protein